MNVFHTSDIWQKIALINSCSQRALNSKPLQFDLSTEIPNQPARDVQVLHTKLHPAKKGLSFKEGQARMLHDLASIELQAMELALRSLYEYPDADPKFRQELYNLTLSEAQHLEMCINTIHELGFKWGDWPIHNGLWNCVSQEDTLIDRVLIVHRYLEGSGLDASDKLLKRLAGVDSKDVTNVVRQINYEEVDHVQFGSRWFHIFCKQQNLDSDNEFKVRLSNLKTRLPIRREIINQELRKKAGFTESEILATQEIQNYFNENF